MLYNYLRFGNAFEFGWHFQLTDFENEATRRFSLQYLWFNFHFYFLQPMQWSVHFPFLRSTGLPPLPAGYGGFGTLYGRILTNCPIAWMALAAPLAWRGRAVEEAALRWFAAAMFLLFVICAATLCLFFAASSRYEVDFLPALLFLAAIGIFGLEHALARFKIRRAIARFLWCTALAYSVVFNVMATKDAHAATHYFVGNFFSRDGHPDKAIEYFNKASTLEPNDAGFHFALANALSEAGHPDESIAQFQKALEIQPRFPEAENNLAFTLLRAGRVDDAIEYFRKASEVQKSYQTFYNLACALRANKMAPEAETNLQKAIELQPQFLPAQIDLSWMLATWPDGAARDGPRALAVAENLNRERPDDPKILQTLAAACAETGHFSEAVVAARRALALAQTQSRTTLVNQLQAEISLYQSNNPCRSFSH